MRFNISPPAIVHTRKNGPDRWARARGPFVSLPYHSSPHQLPHELHHVRQWWAITVISAILLASLHLFVPAVPYHVAGLSVGVFGALYFVSKSFRFWAEVGAYRVSAYVQPKRIGQFAKMLYGYNTGRTLAQCRKAIEGLHR